MYEESRVYTTTTRQEYAGPTYNAALPDINLNLDPSYLQTLPGLLKCLQIAFNFLCFICVLIGGPGYYTGAGAATFISVFGFITTLTLLMLYLFHIVDSLYQIPWILGEMIFCFVWTLGYFIVGSMLAVASIRVPHAVGWAVAAFFAFLALLAYGLDCYLKFLSWKNNEKAMGGRGFLVRTTQQNI